MRRRSLVFALLGAGSRAVSGDECEEVSWLLQTQQVPVEFDDRRLFVASAAHLPLPLVSGGDVIQWNDEQIPVDVALEIGVISRATRRWGGTDVVGPAVYGGIVTRDASGTIVVGDEWPEDNRAPPAFNPDHSTGPYLDFSRFGESAEGYATIAGIIRTGSAEDLEAYLLSIDSPQRQIVANLVMTGGARPLHMCGVTTQTNDALDKIKILIDHFADVNARDNYDKTPLDRLAMYASYVLREHGAMFGSELTSRDGAGPPDWTSSEFMLSLDGC